MKNEFKGLLINELKRLSFLGDRIVAESLLNYYEKNLGLQMRKYLENNLESYSFLYGDDIRIV